MALVHTNHLFKHIQKVHAHFIQIYEFCLTYFGDLLELIYLELLCLLEK